MRLHLRRFFVLILLGAVFFLLLWQSRKGRPKKLRKSKFLLKNEHKVMKGVSPDDIFWTELSGVEKPPDDKLKELKSWIRDNHNFVNDLSASKTNKVVFNLNTEVSDNLPLNRKVPDSRPAGCKSLTYPEDLPTASIVIPFHNEWPSVLMRTIHSLVIGTPRTVLKQIILVDDASSLDALKARLENYTNWTFPEGLVKIIRLKERQGLIRARLEGFKYVTSEVVSFLDSHMEVNKNWIQPLLNEILKNPRTVAMAQLDYIDRETFKYEFYDNYRTRYGFKWDMEFFETYFRPDQLKGKKETDPLPGVLMVGPGFVVRSQYFKDLGLYDSGMKIWGGENIEFAWRTWMCGGQLLHVPCSRIGHIERSQPYTFPQGRKKTEQINYKRAAEVWMGPYKKYVFDALPGMEDLDAGSIEGRLQVKDNLKCKDFSWFLKNIWPELLPYEDVGSLWGQVRSTQEDTCLDNKGYLFKDPVPLELQSCLDQQMINQGFALTSDGHLRTTLHCVVAMPEGADMVPLIQNCLLDSSHKWEYDNQDRLVHLPSSLCLQALSQRKLVLQPCLENLQTQKWTFFLKKS